MMAYGSYESELTALEETLKINHIAPTCPDTLRCLPFENLDPLILESSPHVYFACN